MARRVGWRVVLLVGVLSAFGCDDKKKEKPSPTPSVAASSTSFASASASASASAPSPAKADKWTGTYTSKHVKLETPEKVRDFTWKKDDGTGATGDGQLSLELKAGAVVGKASGPLGPQTVTGVLEDGSLRLRLIPTDPTATLAMTGSGLGRIEDGVLSGKVRCAGSKGVVVREVSFELEPAR